MARIIEYSSKLAGSHKKLSTRFNDLAQIIGEAATWAKIAKSKIVTAEFVDKALEKRKVLENINASTKDNSL